MGDRLMQTIEVCAGPGGFDEAARLLGLDLGIVGVESNKDAAATARAAGHERIVVDAMTLDPADFPDATGLIFTPPCPPFSNSGKRVGLGDDYQRICDAITALGWDECGPDCEQECWRAETFDDPRCALVVETARWVLRMPSITWFVAEQVPGVEYVWEDLAAELFAAGWESVDVVTLDAADYGAAARRTRTFIYGRKYLPSTVTPYPRADSMPRPTFAEVNGWEPGHKVRTRNNRRPTGGNLFSADGPAWCITGKARSWERDGDGLRLTAADTGAAQGFPRDYPWQGSRTSQFQQVGDVVSPLVGAAVLGAALGVEWRDVVRAHAAELAAVPPAPATPEPLVSDDQLALF